MITAPQPSLTGGHHETRDVIRLVYEDELTELSNRRFLRNFFQHRVRWETGQDFPLSLLALDVDHFKSVNDRHGHQAGDQALVWIASLLKEVAGPRGIPVRFAGDEFMLLLPQTDASEACVRARELLRLVRERPFRIRESGVTLPITVSVGVACAPDDARDDRSLLRAADTALYHVKRSGRDQVAAAREVDPHKVFPRTALHRLAAPGLVGRRTHLAAVSGALDALQGGASQMLLFEGAAGTGKTALLELVHGNLKSQGRHAIARARGDASASHSPYHLAQALLASLLDPLGEDGEKVLRDLSPEHRRHLAYVLPRSGPLEEAGESDAAALRRGIFDALSHVISDLARQRPLVLVVDDLHFADEASLLLLYALLKGHGKPLLVIAAAGANSSLEHFLANQGDGLPVRRLTLEALRAGDISEYLRGMFPGLRAPAGLEAELARATHGNPLFLSEVVRTLVLEQRISFEDGAWVARPIEPGVLPGTLQELVRRRIAALDDEGRELIEQASVIGEGSTLSALAGSSRADEARLLDSMERAEEAGLVRLDFESDDEVLRFLGGEIREISYGGMQLARREELHERAGTYEEELYVRGAAPSAAAVAHHYKHSGNQEKARYYETLQEVEASLVFDPEEAARYNYELVETEVETEPPLDPASVPRVPDMLRGFARSVRNMRLYPPGSESVMRSIRDFEGSLAAILTVNGQLHLAVSRQTLLVNGARLPLAEAAAPSEGVVELLGSCELQGVRFRQGVASREIAALIDGLARIKPDTIVPGFWKQFRVERGLQGIDLEQIRYSRVIRRSPSSPGNAAPLDDTALESNELDLVPDLLRALQAAARAARLYPAESPLVGSAATRLHESLRPLLEKRKTVTLAAHEDSLVVNGRGIAARPHGDLALSVVQELESAGLSSVSFSAGVSARDVGTFVAGLREATAGGGPGFWDSVAVGQTVRGIAFNARAYAAGVGILDIVGEASPGEEPAPEDRATRTAHDLAARPATAIADALPRHAGELLLRGGGDLAGELVRKMLEDFSHQSLATREGILRACDRTLETLNVGLQLRFIRLAADPLTDLVATEASPSVLHEFGSLMNRMAGIALRGGDHDLATRFLFALRSREQDAAPNVRENVVRLLERPLDPALQPSLVEDFRSRDPQRRERASMVMGALGVSRTRPLLEIITRERSLRGRLLAASLLAAGGPAAEQEFKRLIMTEPIDDRRVRVLEIADQVTRNLDAELRAALSDRVARVRAAALQLFERLRRDDLVDLVVRLGSDDDVEVARLAIHSLGMLGSPAAAAGLASVLSGCRDPRIAIACCQALGQARCGDSLGPLARILARRRLRLFRWHWDESVRAAAAAALVQLDHESVAGVIGQYVDDPHVGVRSVARAAAGS